MNILLATTHMRMGGVGVYTATLANRLQAAGNRVFVASSGGGLTESLEPGIVKLDVPLDTKSVLSPKVLVSALKLRAVVKKEKIDIVHAQTRVSQAAAQLLSALTGVPYVATWHGFFRPHFLRRAFPFWGEKTIAISKPVYENLKDVFGRKEKDLRLVQNGVETEKYSREYTPEEKDGIRKKYGLGAGPVVGIISRLSEEKGHAVLIDAFREISAKFPGARLLIIGEGRLEHGLRKRAEGLGLGDSVRFFGNTLNAREFLAIMDVFARPGLQEGFGLAIAEAMMMGVPVVSTGVGGFREMLDDGELGVLVEPCDAATLAGAVCRLLTDKALAGRIAAAAKKYAAENFSAERMARQTLEVYKEALDGAGKK
ncbi:MAG: glycosyltransferase family 4 protein [Candidatus Omnitrophica bacterium]|nr:glycosyltransferase family 4 protein [Candidatus Omnitrophota bacterium]MDD5737220.1 glycosyltransferase family 4 protein [Candidatus Omnitrophota bacterium]